MSLKTLKYFFFLALTLNVGCSSEPEDDATYFGGKIINPKTNYVVLFSLDRVIDTLKLNKHNKFFKKFDSIHEGLYHFKHGDEAQSIYLEPKDSLMLRLNTWDFDESLVFAGIGAERNNMLIDCFLEQEKENKIFYSYNKLKPSLFKLKTDSLTKLKLKRYNNYINKHPEETSGFRKILKVGLTYPTYARLERYPLEYSYAKKSTEFPKTDSTFYAFRKHIMPDKDSLMYYYPYSSYIRSYLYNTAFSMGHKPMMNEFSSEFTVDLLNTINEKISCTDSKNAFLKQTAITHFYRKSSCDINKETFDTFLKLTTNEEDKKQIKRLISDNKVLHKGKEIIDFNVMDFNKNSKSINEIIKNKNSYVFFWNPEYVSKNYISSRINYLSKKFPKIQFVQIKMNSNSSDRIKKLDIKTQYYIDAKSKANAFLTSKMPRSILINKKGVITNGYASLSSRNIYSQLKVLEKN